MLNSYHRIFLKFLISSFILACTSKAYSQALNIDFNDLTSKFDYFILSFAITLCVLIVSKIVFNLFTAPPEYHLTREKFEQSLKQSKDAITSLKIEKPQFHAFVENKEINTLISQIINKSSHLLNNPTLENEDKHIAQKSVSSYMPKIIETYKNINPALRIVKSDNQPSAHDMTVEQLRLILSGLQEIEQSLLAKNHDSLKANEYFLNNVFDK